MIALSKRIPSHCGSLQGVKMRCKGQRRDNATVLSYILGGVHKLPWKDVDLFWPPTYPWLSIKPNYFKKQSSLSSFLLTKSNNTGPNWPEVLSRPTMEQSYSICCQLNWKKWKTQVPSKLWQRNGYGKTYLHINHQYLFIYLFILNMLY